MGSFERRFLLIGLAVCAILYGLSARVTRPIAATASGVAVQLEGGFAPDGEYQSEPFPATGVLRRWGSYSGADANEGRLTLGPFPAPAALQFLVGGYPKMPGNELYAEHVGSKRRVALDIGNVGERWQVAVAPLPRAWRGEPIVLVAVDGAKGWGGWFALSEPMRGGTHAPGKLFAGTLAAWTINGLLLGALWLAAGRLLGQRCAVAPHWVPLLAAAVVAAAGYALFWVYLADRELGRGASLFLTVSAIWILWRGRASGARLPVEIISVGRLVVVIGAFYLGLLYLFPSAQDFHTVAQYRFGSLPADTSLPPLIAARLHDGDPVRESLGDWRSSDRPPLQSGWLLLTWPVTAGLKLDAHAASGTAALWLQLTWAAAAYGLFGALGLSQRRHSAWIAVLSLSGFFLLNTTFTWPKLAAGAFACGAFGLWVLPAPGSRSRLATLAGAAMAALAWLAHGGVAFSFLALVPWVVWRCVRGEWRDWVQAALLCAVLLAPWFAYQKFYDPPGNRLLKWHLAGQIAIDERGTWETLRASYGALSGRELREAKRANFAAQFEGKWTQVVNTAPERVKHRRTEEFSFTGRALTWWLPGLALAFIALARFGRARADADIRRPHVALLLWPLATIALWCVLMFLPRGAIVHQGSYAAMIGLFVVASLGFERVSRWCLPAVALLQLLPLVFTWAVSWPAGYGSPAPGPLALAVLGALGLAGIVMSAFLRLESATSEGRPPGRPSARGPDGAGPSDAAQPPGRIALALRAWWREPRITWWVLLALGALLFLRKPHALHTPQLYAEDGSIFLTFNDLDGAGAMLTPYMGYLHTLPRIIAWSAAKLLDPLWWPAFYNGASFLIWLAVIGRMFSARLALPWKPFLALAFFLGAHTGEVLFNITNLQWVTAFVLIQQALIERPANVRQRTTDLLFLALAGLTGPFVIAFVPLFAWRWWRDRHPDNLVVLLLVLACAGIQGWQIAETGPRFEYQSAPFRLWPTIVVLARRLLVWPLLGKQLALNLPAPLIGIVGGLVIAALIAWSLRRDERRELRLQIVAALGLILLAGISRTRPDTWAADNLLYADRYFFIPRVLLTWLFILEFDAVPRFVARCAQAVCLTIAFVHLPGFILEAPPDYRWADHVEPIRRGVPANIPTLPENWYIEYRGRPNRR